MCSEIKCENAIVFTDVIAKLNQLEDVTAFASSEEKEKWIQNLTQLALFYSEVSLFAHEFDFSPSLRYNGIRSYMKMVLAYFVTLSQTVDSVKGDERDKKLAENLATLQGQCSVFLSMGQSVKNVRKIWSKWGNPASNSHQFYSDALQSKIESIEQMDEEALFSYYNLKLMAPWLPNWVKCLVKSTVKGHYLMTTPIHRSLFGFFSDNKISRFWAQTALTFKVDLVQKSTQRMINNWIYASYIWTGNLFTPNVKVSYVSLDDRQREYFIDKKSKSVKEVNEKSSLNFKKPVECVLLKPRDFTSNNLIIHIHGGGFVSMTANSYIPLLRTIVQATEAAVLSINYTLSPQAKYPEALEEIFDVYLNVHSSNPITDFTANKVVLVGESAGGHFVTALSIVLAELRTLQLSFSHPLSPLPSSIVSVYPTVSSLIGHSYPSRALIDTVLVPVCPYSFFNAYSGPLDEKKYADENNGATWHQDVNLLRQVANQINDRVDDPFIHLIGYKNFHRLKDVPLYLLAGEFDPILDDSIHLAKIWQGEVTLDIIPDMPHAWISFDHVAPESFDGVKLMRQRIKEAVARESKIDSKEIKVEIKSN